MQRKLEINRHLVELEFQLHCRVEVNSLVDVVSTAFLHLIGNWELNGGWTVNTETSFNFVHRANYDDRGELVEHI